MTMQDLQDESLILHTIKYMPMDNPDDEEQLKVGKPDVDTAYILPSGWEVIGRDTGLRDYLEIRKRIK